MGSKAHLLATLPKALSDQLQSGRALLNRGSYGAPGNRGPHGARGQDADRELRFPTTVVATDRLLEGGLARGEVVEALGRRTSGRLSLVLATLAAATRIGEAAAFVDLGDHFDPQAAAASGVELERLLWLRPQHLKPALAAAEVVIGGGFPLVVLDLGAPPVPGGRGVEAGWLRLARAAQAHEAALLISSPYRVSGTAARVVLELSCRGSVWQGKGGSLRLLAGLRSWVALNKCRGRPPQAGEGFELALPNDAFPVESYDELRRSRTSLWRRASSDSGRPHREELRRAG